MLCRCLRALLSTAVVAVGLMSGGCTFCADHDDDVDFLVIENRTRDCLAKGQSDAALENADLLVDRYGDSYHAAYYAHYLRAQVHAQRNDAASAIRDLTAAIRTSSGSQVTRLGNVVARGRCYEHSGMHEAAAHDYRIVYDALLEEYADDNGTEGAKRHNYMDLIDFFWSKRQYTDQDFGFKQLEFDKSGSYRETKRARREAVLNWLLGFVDVHPKIVANIHDVDAKVFSLEEDESRDRRRQSSPSQ